MEVAHESPKNLRMNRESSKHSRFYSYLADQRPSRPQRFVSPLTTSSKSKLGGNASSNTIFDTRKMAPICEQVVDDPPICPRRSLSMKRLARERATEQQCQQKLHKLLSFVVDLEGATLNSDCAERLVSPRSCQQSSTSNTSSYKTLRVRKITPTRDSVVDEPPICPRRLLSPSISANEKATEQQESQNTSHELSDCCPLKARSIITFPDLDDFTGNS